MKTASMSGQLTGYRKVLADEFARRVARNPKYSTRAFARDLGVSSGQIVRIIQGTRNLSLLIAKKIADKLFDERALQLNFIHLVELETTTPEDLVDADKKRIKALSAMNHTVHRLDSSVLEKMESWVHFAILDLFTLDNPPTNAESIAEYFGVEALTIKKVIEDLISIGIVVETKGRLQKKHEAISFDGGMPSDAVRRYHRQMIERALWALSEQDRSRRFFSGESIAISREFYPELVKMTEDYLSKVAALARGSAEANALYQVNVQVYDHKKDFN